MPPAARKRTTSGSTGRAWPSCRKDAYTTVGLGVPSCCRAIPYAISAPPGRRKKPAPSRSSLPGHAVAPVARNASAASQYAPTSAAAKVVQRGDPLVDALAARGAVGHAAEVGGAHGAVHEEHRAEAHRHLRALQVSPHRTGGAQRLVHKAGKHGVVVRAAASGSAAAAAAAAEGGELGAPVLKRVGRTHCLAEHPAQPRGARVLLLRPGGLAREEGRRRGRRRLAPPVDAAAAGGGQHVRRRELGEQPHLVDVAVAEHRVDAARVALLQREERAQEAEVGAALVDRVAAEDELRAGCQLERVEVGLAAAAVDDAAR